MIHIDQIDLNPLLEHIPDGFNIPMLKYRLRDHNDIIDDRTCLNWEHCLGEKCGLAKFCCRYGKRGYSHST